MSKYAVICQETQVILEFIRAVDPCLAFKLAKEQYPDREVVVAYAEDSYVD